MQTASPFECTAADLPAAIILQVALPLPLPRLFDYLSHTPCAPGTRVRVNFARRTLVGVVWGTVERSDVPPHKLKYILESLETHPVLPRDIRTLLDWACGYYHHPIGEVVASALPTLLRQGRAAEVELPSCWQLAEAARQLDLATLTRAPKQKAALTALQQLEHPLSRAALQQLGLESAIFKTFKDKQWLQRVPADQVQPLPTATTSAPLTLNADQQVALDHITDAHGSFRAFLLEGVTGSGKTEVYLQAMAACIARGQQVLVLIPEIGLTPQTVARFEARLPVAMVTLHSGLTDKTRTQHWLRAAQGQAQVVIGTRMAVFTPLPNLGLIILDESHDSSFKQHEGFKYSARDLAVVRAKQTGCPVVLGSATPMLETLLNAQRARYQHLKLTQRAGQAQLPTFNVIDIRQQSLKSGLSDALLAHVSQHLSQQGQVLLFLNRRGFAPTLTCHLCGWVAMCSACDKAMTVHQQRQQLHCHHCTRQMSKPIVCPQCKGAQLMALGLGTERIEQQLQQLFPNNTVLRIDRDTTQKKGQLQARLAQADAHGADILIGTQMLAKGHHFKNLTLVAVIDADSGLFSTDFRATEQLGQLLTQVAGRAGRADKAGVVVVQTRHPNHPLLNLIVQSDYAAFSQALFAEREAARLPPFQNFALLSAECQQPTIAQQFLKTVKQTVQALSLTSVDVHGPVPAPMQKRAGFYRLHLLLQSPSRAQLQQALTALHAVLYAPKWPAKLRWSLDVDPIDMM